ncbi:MAG: hypothetical protein V4660_14535 [Pseudomonadota bacterium]
MLKIIVFAHMLQWMLIILLMASALGFLSFTNIYGLFLASITAFIAWGAHKNKQWAYFTAAAWGLACYQLAKQGYEFQTIKYWVMIIGVLVIPVALFLHEILGQQKNVRALKSVKSTASDNDLPQ